jgi:hypothetical protein
MDRDTLDRIAAHIDLAKLCFQTGEQLGRDEVDAELFPERSDEASRGRLRTARTIHERLISELRTSHPLRTGRAKSYRTVYIPDHPLANKNGRVTTHRLVLWEKVEGRDVPCHWCGRPLFWRNTKRGADTLCVDHVDYDIHNNHPDNLEATCQSCNTGRKYANRTHCKNGHPLTTPDSLYTAPGSGKSSCRGCLSDAQKRVRRRRESQGL